MKTNDKKSVGTIRVISRRDGKFSELYTQLNDWLSSSGWGAFLELKFEKADLEATERIEFIQGQFQSNPSTSYIGEEQKALSFARTWIEEIMNHSR